MPFDYETFAAESLGRAKAQLAQFDPPKLSPLRKRIEESTIGVFVSCGAQLGVDPLLQHSEDTSFRLLHRDIPLSALTIRHPSHIRKWAEEDLNVAYPLDRLKELEAEGTFKRLAHTAISMVGAVQQFTKLMESTVPAMVHVYEAQGVDIVMLFPFCPGCHRTVGVIARGLEARGMPTTMPYLHWELAHANKPPRTCFLDFPFGCPSGKPHEAEQQREILRTVLKLAPQFNPDHYEVKRLPFNWSADGSRAWEEELKSLYLNGGFAVKLAAEPAHAKLGESLVGREHEFSIKCNC